MMFRVHEATKPRKGLAITSLILGILSVFCLGILAGIPAIIIGHAARGRVRRAPGSFSAGGLALAGLILGYLSIPLTLLLLLAMLPAFGAAKSQAESMQCASNLRQIGMAVRLYAEVHQGNYPQTPAEFGPNLGYSRFLVCPQDLALKGRKIEVKDFSRTSYTLTLAGASESTPDNVIARCPTHGHVLTADGRVRPGKRPVPF
jgi:hypothetical protein